MSSVPSHVGILRSGANAWNAWRQENPTAIPNLAGIALGASERQLGPMHGGPINLKAALLRDAELRFAILTTADLAAADLAGADLAHARLDHADLRGANLGGSCLDYASLDGADLSGLSLRRASLRFTSLAAANLEAADLSGANLTHARLSEANLRAANLRGARLDYADFAGAELATANLRGADLQSAKNLTLSQLEQSLGDASTKLPAHLQGSVSWSPARTEAAPFVPMLAPGFTVRRPAKSHSFRPLLWITASVWITAFAASAWWQYGENDRSPLSSTHHGPLELKISQLPPVTALRTIDQPDIALPALGKASETLNLSRPSRRHTQRFRRCRPWQKLRSNARRSPKRGKSLLGKSARIPISGRTIGRDRQTTLPEPPSRQRDSPIRSSTLQARASLN